MKYNSIVVIVNSISIFNTLCYKSEKYGNVSNLSILITPVKAVNRIEDEIQY